MTASLSACCWRNGNASEIGSPDWPHVLNGILQPSSGCCVTSVELRGNFSEARRHFLAGHFVEQWFRIERLHLARPAGHHQKNHGLRLRGEMWQLRRERIQDAIGAGDRRRQLSRRVRHARAARAAPTRPSRRRFCVIQWRREVASIGVPKGPGQLLLDMVWSRADFSPPFGRGEYSRAG